MVAGIKRHINYTPPMSLTPWMRDRLMAVRELTGTYGGTIESIMVVVKDDLPNETAKDEPPPEAQEEDKTPAIPTEQMRKELRAIPTHLPEDEALGLFRGVAVKLGLTSEQYKIANMDENTLKKFYGLIMPLVKARLENTDKDGALI